jgi:hypothetical protein
MASFWSSSSPFFGALAASFWTGEPMSALAAIIFLIIGLFLYFLPAIIAVDRRHEQGLAIFVLNLLLGWTALGWILALVWACTAVKKPSLPAV